MYRIRGDRAENLEKAIELYKEALEIRVPQTFPRKCRETSMKLSEAEMERRRWDDVIVSADRARHADRILVRTATSVTGKSHEIEESAALYYHASLACARLGDVTGSVEWLEQGKTRELGESLARGRALFRHVIRGEDRDEYLGIQERLRVLEAEQRGAVPGARSFTEVAEDARKTHETLDTLIRRIQQYEPEFLRETTITRDEILSLLTGGTKAYVIFNVTGFGTAVILLAVVDGSPVAETFFNEDFTTDTMDRLTGRWSEGLGAMRRGKAVMGEGQMKWWSEIDDTGRKLYRNLFSPVHEWLREKADTVRELVFVPHLSLHILPLHLMRYDGEEGSAYLVEDYEVSFAPSLSVILRGKGIQREPEAELFEREREESASAAESAPESVPDFASDFASDSAPGVVLVSNPTGDLRYARDEVARIESIVPQKRAVLSGKDASVERLIASSPGAKLFHFSCHGEFDPVEPWNSGLVLADDRAGSDDSSEWSLKEEEEITGQSGEMAGDAEYEKENELCETVCTRDSTGKVIQEVRPRGEGVEELISYDAEGRIRSRIRSLADGRSYVAGKGRLFTLKEIASTIDLSRTELVVLSACETGLVGFGGKSDEFVGLPGGFLRVGAKNVVASLWVVDDEGTAKLMEHFYRNLFEEKSTPARALRKAQLEIMRDPRWKNPYYWGAFRAFGV